MSTALHIYPTPPQKERKAVAEIRRGRYKALLPLDKTTRKLARGRVIEHRQPLIRGYVYAHGRPNEAQYSRPAIGRIRPDELGSLFRHVRARPVIPKTANPYRAGDTVIVTKGHLTEVRAIVKSIRARACLIEFSMAGKAHQQAIPYQALKPG